MGSRLVTLALDTGVVIAWSSGFVGAILASKTPSIFGVLFWRFVIITVLLAPFLWMAFRHRRGWRWYLLHGALGCVGMFGCLAFGIKAIDLGTPAGTAAIIAALQPLLTAALAGPVLKEVVSIRQWLGLLIGLAGVSVAVGQVGAGDVLGYAFAFASMLCIVIATLMAKAGWDNGEFMPSFAFQSLVTTICVAPFAWADGALLPLWDLTFAAAVLWAIVLSTAGGYGLYYLSLRRTSAVRLGSLLYLTPPVTMIWAWLLFGQPVTLAAVAGFAICILGVWLARSSSAPMSAKTRPADTTAGRA